MPDKCPVPGCTNKKKIWQALCLAHWRKVPKALQDQIWFEYRNHPKSDAHLGVLAEAIVAVMQKEGRTA